MFIQVPSISQLINGIIRTARKTKTSYKLTELCYQDIVNLKTLSRQVRTNYNDTTSNELINTNENKK